MLQCQQIWGPALCFVMCGRILLVKQITAPLWAKIAVALARQVDYTKFALFFNHTEPHWLAEVPGGVQWQLNPDGPHPDHPTDAHWCGST